MNPNDIERKVGVGIATVAGYAAALGAVLTPLVAYIASLQLNDNVTSIFVAAAAVLAVITTWGRQYQAGQQDRAAGETLLIDPVPEVPTDVQPDDES